MKMPTSTVRAINNKFKTTGAVVNMLGKGGKCVFASTHQYQGCSEKQKTSPRITVGYLQTMIAFWGHQLSKTTIRCTSMPTNCLQGKLLLNHNHKHLKLLDATGTLTGTKFYTQMRQNLSFLVTNTQSESDIKRMVIKKRTSSPRVAIERAQ